MKLTSMALLTTSRMSSSPVICQPVLKAMHIDDCLSAHCRERLDRNHSFCVGAETFSVLSLSSHLSSLLPLPQPSAPKPLQIEYTQVSPKERQN